MRGIQTCDLQMLAVASYHFNSAILNAFQKVTLEVLAVSDLAAMLPKVYASFLQAIVHVMRVGKK
jgi:hypothetical protein